MTTATASTAAGGSTWADQLSNHVGEHVEQLGDQDVEQGGVGRWLGVDEAATALGINPSTVRRRAREGKLQVQKVHRPQGYTLRVFVSSDEQVAGPSSAQLGKDIHTPGMGHEQVAEPNSAQLPVALDRAEAMASYNRALLEPLVHEINELTRRLELAAAENGRLGAELATARAQLEIQQRPWWRRLWAPA